MGSKSEFLDDDGMPLDEHVYIIQHTESFSNRLTGEKIAHTYTDIARAHVCEDGAPEYMPIGAEWNSIQHVRDSVVLLGHINVKKMSITVFDTESDGPAGNAGHMREAPERIWAAPATDEFGTYQPFGRFGAGPRPSDSHYAATVEYVRADIAERKNAELREKISLQELALDDMSNALNERDQVITELRAERDHQKEQSENFFRAVAAWRSRAEDRSRQLADALATIKIMRDQYRKQQEHDGKLIAERDAALREIIRYENEYGPCPAMGEIARAALSGSSNGGTEE